MFQGLLYGLSKAQISKMREGSGRSYFEYWAKFSCDTSAVELLRLLPVRSQSCFYKFGGLNFKALHGLLPLRLSKLISVHRNPLAVLGLMKDFFLNSSAGVMLPTLGARSFYATASELKNNTNLKFIFYGWLFTFQSHLYSCSYASL